MLKAGKLHSIASSAILANLFKYYLNKWGKNMLWWLFAQMYKYSTDCFVLKVSTVNTVTRFWNRICIAIQEKENDIYLAS